MKNLANLVQPVEGSEVEFWTGRMDQAGRGIRGWFRDKLFWSHDNADHWTCNEIDRWTPWKALLHTKSVVMSGKAAVLVCDGNCGKAWGINARPKHRFDANDADDTALLADHELGVAKHTLPGA